MPTVGEELKRIRLANNNMSAQKLADYLGVSADRLRKWEDLGLRPNDEDSKKIEDYFEIPLDELDVITKFKFNAKKHPNPSNLNNVENIDLLIASNKKQVDINADLVSIIKSMQNTIADALAQKQVSRGEVIEEIVSRIAHQCIGQSWTSPAEGLQVLGKILAGKKQSSNQ